jgi:Tol biopolymer transport system component
MTRRNGVLLLVAFICSLVGACGRMPAAVPNAPNNPAILLSVPDDAIYLVAPDTGTRWTLVRALPDFRAGFATWSPDRRRLAFGDDGVVLLDTTTGRSRPIVKGRGLSMPSWSPDGKQLVYSDGLSMWLVDAGGSNATRIRLLGTLAPLALSWSPGGLIAFEGLHLDCSASYRCQATDQSEVWAVRPDGTDLRTLTRVGHAEKPMWSPDDSHVLFVRRWNPAGAGRSELWTVNADGSGAHRLIDATNVVAAAWSPDGARLAVVRRGPDEGTLQLWAGAADGSGLHAVGDPFAGTEASIDW